ncbi:hypothetical protein SAMN05216509_5354 [Pseudomonas sp. B10]|uniref:hypothetical protein n=1 Tax=Pseudomonas sp. B10 TaxID=118613 RepID=UPI0009538F69|nr:hypothetical protein [Pseudomonas sp. B10]SIR84280.1 hypothetical protein SAMN05216509_5354 [Pseudomonas sp. B10]
MSTDEVKKVKAVSVYLSNDDYKVMLESHELKLPLGEISLFKLIGLQYVVGVYNRIPSWVLKAEEVLLPQEEGGLVTVRFSELRSLSWGKPEVPEVFRYHSFERMRPELLEFSDEAFFSIGDEVQLRTDLHRRGFLSLDEAVVKLAESYRVGKSQVHVSISGKA